MNQDQNDKIYRGNEKPSDSLFESTIAAVEDMCKTNNQTYIFRNVVELMNKCLESNLRSMIYLLLQHGNNTKLDYEEKLK
jgi:hypothetical protein